MPAAIEISALPKDKRFFVEMEDDFGRFTHGPCKIDKAGRVVFIDTVTGQHVPIRTDLPIVGYSIIEEPAKQPWDL